jgi:glycosyltransferase involved in cell wall biosynthesis
MGKPMILGVTGVSTDLINEYNAGLAIEPESPDAFARAVKALKSDAGRRNSFSEGARNIARDYDRDGLADLMLAEIMPLWRD